jgi:hypothetical protein
MEQLVFYYLIVYRGHHRKGVVIYTDTEVSIHQKLWFQQRRMYF